MGSNKSHFLTAQFLVYWCILCILCTQPSLERLLPLAVPGLRPGWVYIKVYQDLWWLENVTVHSWFTLRSGFLLNYSIYCVWQSDKSYQENRHLLRGWKTLANARSVLCVLWIVHITIFSMVKCTLHYSVCWRHCWLCCVLYVVWHLICVVWHVQCIVWYVLCVVYCVTCAVCCLTCAVCYLTCAVCCLPFAMCYAIFYLCHVLCDICRVLW